MFLRQSFALLKFNSHNGFFCVFYNKNDEFKLLFFARAVLNHTRRKNKFKYQSDTIVTRLTILMQPKLKIKKTSAHIKKSYGG